MRTLKTMLLSIVLIAVSSAAESAGYRLIKTIPVGGAGSWDYLTVDETARRVFISHSSEVIVLDADTYEIVGKIADLQGVHGIAPAPELGRGFVTNGKANNVTVFDLKSLKPLATVETGKKPDAIIYDAVTQQVFAFNGAGKSATVIEAKDSKVAGTIELGGTPEFAVADGMGSVFVNLEDKSTLVKIDARKLKVEERWLVTPGEEPSSLAMDTKNRRLFIGCRNKILVVMNADTGKVVDKQPIGERVDASAFDPEKKLVFCSNGDGTVTVIHQASPDTYSVAATIKTLLRSKTMALDTKTHRLFIPAAKFMAPADNPKARPAVVPGTFEVRVYGK